MNSIKIAIVDDHILLRKGLAALIDDFDDYKVLFEANNGKDFTEKVDVNSPPDIVLMDINMPEMDGYETALWIRKMLPACKVLALSMFDNDTAVLRMIKNGARGYVLKDIEPADLKLALNCIVTKG